MALPTHEVIRWLQTLSEDAQVGVDEGGLVLRSDVDPHAYLEVGGMPEEHVLKMGDKCPHDTDGDGDYQQHEQPSKHNYCGPRKADAAR